MEPPRAWMITHTENHIGVTGVATGARPTIAYLDLAPLQQLNGGGNGGSQSCKLLLCILPGRIIHSKPLHVDLASHHGIRCKRRHGDCGDCILFFSLVTYKRLDVCISQSGSLWRSEQQSVGRCRGALCTDRILDLAIGPEGTVCLSQCAWHAGRRLRMFWCSKPRAALLAQLLQRLLALVKLGFQRFLGGKLLLLLLRLGAFFGRHRPQRRGNGTKGTENKLTK